MKTDLIFYLARRTSYCEKALKKQLTPLGINFNSVAASTTPAQLGKKLTESFKRCNLVFIIGGLGFTGKNSLGEVLSGALSTTRVTADNVKKLKNELGKQYGYVIRCGNQTIVALPDKPEELSKMFSPALVGYLKSTYNL
ncbi:MAG: molybdopterin-binding protein [Eubacteriales bacterium]|nr:molybdopterin-binding protein [Eubacteriales bacterium]